LTDRSSGWARRKREPKGSTVAGLALYANVPTVGLHRQLTERKAEAGADPLLLHLDLTELLEDLLVVFWSDTRTGVAYLDARNVALASCDYSDLTSRGVHLIALVSKLTNTRSKTSAS